MKRKFDILLPIVAPVPDAGRHISPVFRVNFITILLPYYHVKRRKETRKSNLQLSTSEGINSIYPVLKKKHWKNVVRPDWHKIPLLDNKRWKIACEHLPPPLKIIWEEGVDVHWVYGKMSDWIFTAWLWSRNKKRPNLNFHALTGLLFCCIFGSINVLIRYNPLFSC